MGSRYGQQGSGSVSGPELQQEALRHLELAARHRDRGETVDMQYELVAAQVKANLAQTAVAQEYIPTLRQALDVLLPQVQAEDRSNEDKGPGE